MRTKIERAGSGPGTLERNVFQTVFDEFADPRRAVDVRYDLQQKIGLFERGPDGGEVGRPVFVAHRGGCDANRTIIERADNRVDFGAQTRLCQLLWKTPELAPAGDRRVVVQEHPVRITAPAAAKRYRDDLSAFGVV